MPVVVPRRYIDFRFFCRMSKHELKRFYSSLFPWAHIWNMYGHPGRVFQFTIGDIFTAPYRFPTCAAFKDTVISLAPSVIHIGHVTQKRPTDIVCPDFPEEEMEGKKLITREFVIDIDLDCLPHRHCCGTKKKVCWKCVFFCDLAVESLTCLLHEMLDLDIICGYFSGRRGAHIVASDPSSFFYDQKARSALFEYIQGCYDPFRHTPNYIEDALGHYCKYNDQLSVFMLGLENQIVQVSNCLRRSKLPSVVCRVALVNAARTQAAVQTVLSPKDTTRQVYNTVMESLRQSQAEVRRVAPADGRSRVSFKAQFVLATCGLRLDAPVTSYTKHLFACPFVPHPSTGIIAIPLPSQYVAMTLDQAMENPSDYREIVRAHITKYLRLTRPDLGIKVPIVLCD